MRLIDADAIEYVAEYIIPLGNGVYKETQVVFKDSIDVMPTIDAVPVVRCRDCEFWGTHFSTVNRKYGNCFKFERGTRADFYCGWGSKNDETN